MARPCKEDIQIDKSKGRFFCRIDYSTHKQRKVYLTTHEKQSAKWYKAIAPLVSDDPETAPDNHHEANRRVAMLESARGEGEEKRIIERFTTVPRGKRCARLRSFRGPWLAIDSSAHGAHADEPPVSEQDARTVDCRGTDRGRGGRFFPTEAPTTIAPRTPSKA